MNRAMQMKDTVLVQILGTLGFQIPGNPQPPRPGQSQTLTLYSAKRALDEAYEAGFRNGALARKSSEDTLKETI